MKTKTKSMKTLKPLAQILLLAALTLAGPSLFGQGAVNFANNVLFTTAPVTAPNGHADRLIYNTDNSTLTTGTNWLAQLFYTLGGSQSESILTAIDASPRRFFPTGILPGRWQPVTKLFTNAGPGVTVTLQVRVWDGSVYTSYATALANGGITGKSLAFNYVIPNSTTPPPSAFYMEGLQSFTLGIGAPPIITTQPTGSIVYAGASASLSVTASGSGTLSYQWLKNGTNLAGASSSVLSFAPVQTTDAGIYSVSVSNSFGTVISSNAELTVVVSPYISTQPADITSVVGTTADLWVVAGGTEPLNYQWLKDGTNLAGATSSSLSFGALALTDAGSYSVVVANNYDSVVSSNAQLTVVVPPSIITQPIGGTYVVETAAHLSVVADGTGPLNYQWLKNGTTINGATFSALLLDPIESPDAGSYSVVISNNFGSVTSSPAVLSVIFEALPIGHYTGLFYEDDEVKHQSSGCFYFGLDEDGKFVGKIQSGGGSYKMMNKFSGTNYSASVMIPRGDQLPDLQVNLQLQGVHGTVRVIGTVSDGNWVASLHGYRADYLTSSNAPQVGTYTMVLLSDGDGVSSPGNGSSANVQVSENGVISMAGRLSDGASINQVTTLSKDGVWPLYVPLYKGKGSLLGWITFTNTESSAFTGDASWIKTEAFGPDYQQGFTNIVTAVGTRRNP